ncbi:hypothetical protein FOL47_000171 [Perkinsus chesapeaki]|uniref:SET domain-containing protein n=1 Tax=Perkinsus chesapeaki TaxID=330153 RepID=A0A7J6KY38_PERCH|nr:hypothetical protein FOL47_000171 [Perkinsus chesapeaki]
MIPRDTTDGDLSRDMIPRDTTDGDLSRDMIPRDAEGLDLPMIDQGLHAHDLISTRFPKCPARLVMWASRSAACQSGTYTKKPRKLRMCDRGNLYEADGSLWGRWWPHSSFCLAVTSGATGVCTYFEHKYKDIWMTPCASLKLVMRSELRGPSSSFDDKLLRTDIKIASRGPTGQLSHRFNTRTRQVVMDLPPSPLDCTHRLFLKAMGLRVAIHAVCGRVLIASRCFEPGDCILFCRVIRHSARNDGSDQVDGLLAEGHPVDSMVWLIDERGNRLWAYYNRSTFSLEDPIGSGDIWYLVNHSAEPNTQLHGLQAGVCVKAKRHIYPGEPITWRYPLEYFDEEDEVVSLPRFITIKSNNISDEHANVPKQTEEDLQVRFSYEPNP